VRLSATLQRSGALFAHGFIRREFDAISAYNAF
jgi:hypothetical protein